MYISEVMGPTPKSFSCHEWPSLRIETYGDSGIPHFKKIPCDITYSPRSRLYSLRITSVQLA